MSNEHVRPRFLEIPFPSLVMPEDRTKLAEHLARGRSPHASAALFIVDETGSIMMSTAGKGIKEMFAINPSIGEIARPVLVQAIKLGYVFTFYEEPARAILAAEGDTEQCPVICELPEENFPQTTAEAIFLLLSQNPEVNALETEVVKRAANEEARKIHDAMVRDSFTKKPAEVGPADFVDYYTDYMLERLESVQYNLEGVEIFSYSLDGGRQRFHQLYKVAKEENPTT